IPLTFCALLPRPKFSPREHIDSRCRDIPANAAEKYLSLGGRGFSPGVKPQNEWALAPEESLFRLFQQHFRVRRCAVERKPSLPRQCLDGQQAPPGNSSRG